MVHTGGATGFPEFSWVLACVHLDVLQCSEHLSVNYQLKMVREDVFVYMESELQNPDLFCFLRLQWNDLHPSIWRPVSSRIPDLLVQLMAVLIYICCASLPPRVLLDS